MIQRLLLLLLLLATVPADAFAMDLRGTALRFRDLPANAREQNVVEFLYGKGLDKNLTFKIAAIDLNGDGVDEWVFQQNVSPACTQNATCDFYVVGISSGEPLILGRIEAGKVTISDDAIYGVKKLIVYNDKNNDYRGEPYLWSPKMFSFVSLTTFLR